MASGDWSLQATSGATAILTFGGNLTATGSSVTGNLLVFSTDGCFPLSQGSATVAVNGTITAGSLPLTVTEGGTTFTITLSVPSSTTPATSLTGTYSASGGCEDGVTGNISAQLVTGSIGGTWVATDTVTGSTLSLDFTVPSSPNTSGSLIGAYPLTAVALTLTGPTGCPVTGAAFNTTDTITSGSIMLIDIQETENGTPSEFGIAGTVDNVAAPTTINGYYGYVSGGSCLLNLSTTTNTAITFTKQ